MMLRVPTWVLSFFGLSFGLFHATLGVIWIIENNHPGWVIAALGLYIAVLISTIAVGKSRIMPKPLAWVNLVVCAVIPIFVNSQLNPTKFSYHAIWYVLGVGTILGGTAIRGRRIFAWIGFAVLITEIAIWGGVSGLANTGLPGVLSLLVTGHAVSSGVERAIRSAKELNYAAALTAAEAAAIEAAGRLPSSLIEKILRNALPALSLIAALGGKLTDAQKREALLLEAGLRDEIRGAALLNDLMRQSIKSARELGVEVLVLDEGGLNDLDDNERNQLLDKTAKSFEQVSEGRLTIRAPEGEDWRITVVAVHPGNPVPDLWLKLS